MVVANQETILGDWAEEDCYKFDSIMDCDSDYQFFGVSYSRDSRTFSISHDKLSHESYGLTNYVGYEHVGGGDPMFGDVLEFTYSHSTRGLQKQPSDGKQSSHSGSQYQRPHPNAPAGRGTEQAPPRGYVPPPPMDNPSARSKYDPTKQSPYGGHGQYVPLDDPSGEYGADSYGHPEGCDGSSYGPRGYSYDPANPALGGYGGSPSGPPGGYGGYGPPEGYDHDKK